MTTESDCVVMNMKNVLVTAGIALIVVIGYQAYAARQGR